MVTYNSPLEQLSSHISPLQADLPISLPTSEDGWTALLQLANVHKVTPLWALCLERRGFLSSAPIELQEYLLALVDANRDRNQEFLTAWFKFHARLQKNGGAAVLLKGGAALVDQLYQDSGARIIGDLDMLVSTNVYDEIPQILEAEGYHWDLEEEEYWRRWPRSSFHHFPRAFREGSCVVIEVHYQILSQEGNSGFDLNDFWANTDQVSCNDQTISLPDVTSRLLHNAVHALADNRAWSTSQLELRDLSEWAWLLEKYRDDFDGDRWNRFCVASRWGRALSVYAGLASHLFGIALPEEISAAPKRSWQRFLPRGSVLSRLDRRMRPFVSYPLWLWHNHRYAIPEMSTGQRLCYLCKALFRKKTWQNIGRHWEE